MSTPSSTASQPAAAAPAAAGRADTEAGAAGAAQGPTTTSRAVQKGQQTRAAILDAALKLASQMGLEGLSIGALAEVMQMSKSGVFAHFGSREELQISVIREYHARFEEEVFFPAIREPRGLPRLAALFERWIRRVSVELDSGCIYISGAVEFDDRPGPVRDALVDMVRTWHTALERAIQTSIEVGHLRADADAAQMLFEVHGLILALHHDWRFLRNEGVLDRARVGFARVIAFYQPAGAAPLVAMAAPAKAAAPASAARRTAASPSRNGSNQRIGTSGGGTDGKARSGAAPRR